MDSTEFRERGREVIDYIVDYLESLPERRVSATVSAGYLIASLPPTAPKTPESFEKIMEDVENYIMPGLTHWQHPGFHAYIPSCSSFAATLGNSVADVLGLVQFDWNLSPAGSELELIMVNWYGRMIGMPECFMQLEKESRGCGIILKSTSECIFIAMLTARRCILRKLGNKNPSLSTAILLSSLVAYCSTEAHACVEKIATINLVNVRVLETEDDFKLHPKTIAKAIEEDKQIGLIPFFVVITLGSVSCGSCDPIHEIGLICEKHEIWLHVDASYGGNALACPEFRHYLKGVEYASSLNSDPSRGLMVHYDTSVLFVKDKFKMKDTVIVDKTSFGYNFSEMDWGYPCRTEFRAMKFLFVMRNFGIEGIQKHIRNFVQLAKMFATLVSSDKRFELVACHFGIVCFRLKGSDLVNKILKTNINSSGKLYLTPCCLSNKYVIRFAICSRRSNEDDVKYGWKVICEVAENVLNEDRNELPRSSTEIIKNCYKYTLP